MNDKIREILLTIWEDVLGFSVDDCHLNFFAIGGSSMQALEIVNLISQKLNVELQLNEFFDGASINELGDRINVILSKK
jgi:acyl carrier protein